MFLCCLLFVVIFPGAHTGYLFVLCVMNMQWYGIFCSTATKSLCLHTAVRTGFISYFVQQYFKNLEIVRCIIHPEVRHVDNISSDFFYCWRNDSSSVPRSDVIAAVEHDPIEVSF